MQPITWEWGATDPIPYPVVPNWYSPSPPEGGVLGYVGNEYPPDAGLLNDDFVGVDVRLEDATVSSDWDLAGLSSP